MRMSMWVSSLQPYCSNSQEKHSILMKLTIIEILEIIYLHDFENVLHFN